MQLSQEAKSESEVLREDLRNTQNCLNIVETERNELQRRLEVGAPRKFT